MKLSQVCIDRPVLSTVMSLVILLAGAIALGRVPNRELPDVDPPVVSVIAILPGAAPEVVETSVTQVLEDQIVGIEGVRSLVSLSREQVSQITVEFELDRDVEAAANDVRDRVARARRSLPEELENPVVAKRDADSDPVLWLALAGANHSQLELSTIAEKQIQDRLGKLPGVAQVVIGGERRYAMRVWIDNDRLTAQDLTIADVAAALRRENVDLPSGRVEGTEREFTVRTLGELDTAEAFGELIVANVGGDPVRLRDVGRVEVGPEDERKIVRFNGEAAVGLGVLKQSRANTLDVARAVKAELADLADELPPDVVVHTAFDSSTFIERSIEDVTKTIFESVVLVIVVIWIFLRSGRATLVPTVAIPVSVIGTFAVLQALGFSVNTLTLMGLTLAIGLVVDDAIVVLENVTRWIEMGHPPLEAARRGMNEISFAVIATTISAVAVFLPLSFLTDTTGRLFREFGITVATAVLISGFVALTLSPALCARLLRRHEQEHGLRAWLAEALEGLNQRYERGLRFSVARAGRVSLLGFAWFVAGLALLGVMKSEFVPPADRDAFFVFTRAPEGSTISFTDRWQREAEARIRAMPEVTKAFSVVALGLGVPAVVNEGAVFGSLVPRSERDRSQDVVVAEMGRALSQVAGMQAFASSPPALGRSFGGAPVSLVIQGPDIHRLAAYSDEIVRRARAIPELQGVRSDLLLNKPQIEVHVDRNRASDLGVSVRDVATTLQILLGGLDLTTFKLGGETYKVMAQLEASERQTAASLARLYVRGRGQLVPLASLASAKETISARGLPHYDRLRSATIQAALAPGAALGPALRQMQAVADEVLPTGAGYRSTFSGESRDFFESGNALLFAYILAVGIIYLVLAAQFESWFHPVTILVAVALSFTGALISLWLLGGKIFPFRPGTLNLFSQIGLVMLIGLVTKNSILIVEFANQLREQGRDLVSATFEASRARFRPILMTALSTIVGILPIAIGAGAGGESRAPLGIAVAGGMFFSTVLTIFVVPAAYIALERLRARVTGGISVTSRELGEPAG